MGRAKATLWLGCVAVVLGRVVAVKKRSERFMVLFTRGVLAFVRSFSPLRLYGATCREPCITRLRASWVI